MKKRAYFAEQLPRCTALLIFSAENKDKLPMKKLFLLLITLISCLGLASCAAESVALPKMTDLIFLRRHPIAPFSAEESGRMQSVMSANRARVSGETLYTLELDDAHQPVLVSYSIGKQGLSDFRVLAGNCVPKWLTEHDGYLYYINELNGGRIERLKPGDAEPRQLTDYACSYLQIKDGRLYFCDEAGYFCTAAADGSDKRVIIDKPCCYVYQLGEVIIFQSESEGEILKLRFSTDGKAREVALTERAAYAPLIIGERLYYTMDGQIHSMNLDGLGPETMDSPRVSGAAEYVLEGSGWYVRAISEDYGITQWRCPVEGGPAEENGYKGYLYCDFADAQWWVDADYFSDGRLRSFILNGPKGSRSEYLYGEVTNIR